MTARRSRHPDRWRRSDLTLESICIVSWARAEEWNAIAGGIPFEVVYCQRPRTYVMTYGKAIKFGIANDPWLRTKQVRRDVEGAADLEAVRAAAGSDPEMRLRFVGYGGPDLETAVQRYWMRDHLAGEWFAFSDRTPEVLNYLIRIGLLTDAGPVELGSPGILGRHPVEAIARINAKWRAVAEARS